MQRAARAINVSVMKVVTAHVHPDPRSCCRAVLEPSTVGLQDARDGVQVVDLDAIEFDPAPAAVRAPGA